MLGSLTTTQGNRVTHTHRDTNKLTVTRGQKGNTWRTKSTCKTHDGNNIKVHKHTGNK